jgi:hypothetical protein
MNAFEFLEVKPYIVRLHDTFILGLSCSVTFGETRLGICLGVIEMGISFKKES